MEYTEEWYKEYQRRQKQYTTEEIKKKNEYAQQSQDYIVANRNTMYTNKSVSNFQKTIEDCKEKAKYALELKKTAYPIPPTKIEIPLKLPSLNDYIDDCRANRFAGANLKKRTEEDIMWFLKELPIYEKPIKINFTWVEADKRRDYDNICFAKKFILDALQKSGKLKNDNRKCVCGFTDNFEVGKEHKVILEIKEV
jgi:Holliday junction resolvase RusA-like endonuclease